MRQRLTILLISFGLLLCFTGYSFSTNNQKGKYKDVANINIHDSQKPDLLALANLTNQQDHNAGNIDDQDRGVPDIGDEIRDTEANNADHADLNRASHVEGEQEVEQQVEHGGKHEGGGHGGMEPLFFVILALIIGAVTRHFFKKIPLPFTVLLMIFGLILGALARFHYLEWSETVSLSIEWAGNIDPHLILFVFLPTLIFEAAFAMDVHTFKKTSTNAIILAVPGIIVALLLTGILMIAIDKLGIGAHGWGAYAGFISFMFGAVISATDPVAVVSILKELGASKKLGTLIEGESMLNDGTAIVFFMVFYVPLTVVAAASNPGFEFLKVVIGGVLLGLIIAGVTLAWVKRVFNDMLIEISVIIAAAYLTFYVAEGFLHVSGVLGLVSLGLVMAGVGKTRISPEVQHFLHEFWEMAAFIANTLIFIIVGVVIAQRTEFTANDFIVLGILYVGIHIVRAIVIAIFYPLLKRIGYGLNLKEATVVWYGALRGAIGLALALVIANVEWSSVPDSLKSEFGYSAEQFDVIKQQFLFLTAGVVVLSLLINATTIKLVVNKLGLTKIAPAKALMIHSANEYLRESSVNSLERLKSDRFISNANWSEVKEYLPQVPEDSDIKGVKIDTMDEMRKRLLEKEKSSYWYQFKEGLLGPVSVRRLSENIEELLDIGGLQSLSQRKDMDLLMKTPKLLSRLQTVPLFKDITRNAFFERLSRSYDIARGFVDAQEECLKLVESIQRSLTPGDKESNANLSIIETEINENKIEGLTFIRNLRKSYPEIYDAIATRQAIRSLLNYQLKTVERLQKNGRIDDGEAHKMIHTIEEKMKKLLLSPPKVKLQNTEDFIREISWLADMPEDVIKKLSKHFVPRVFSLGASIMKATSPADGIYLIARGSIKIVKGDTVIDIMGEGTVIGESLITGNQRTSSVLAESPVTSFFLSADHLKQIMAESKEFDTRIWKIAGERYAANQLRETEPYCFWRPKKFKNWISNGRVVSANDKDLFELDDEIAILFAGTAKIPGSTTEINAPSLLHVSKFSLKGNGHAFIVKASKE